MFVWRDTSYRSGIVVHGVGWLSSHEYTRTSWRACPAPVFSAAAFLSFLWVHQLDLDVRCGGLLSQTRRAAEDHNKPKYLTCYSNSHPAYRLDDRKQQTKSTLSWKQIISIDRHSNRVRPRTWWGIPNKNFYLEAKLSQRSIPANNVYRNTDAIQFLCSDNNLTR